MLEKYIKPFVVYDAGEPDGGEPIVADPPEPTPEPQDPVEPQITEDQFKSWAEKNGYAPVQQQTQYVQPQQQVQQQGDPFAPAMAKVRELREAFENDKADALLLDVAEAKAVQRMQPIVQGMAIDHAVNSYAQDEAGRSYVRERLRESGFTAEQIASLSQVPAFDRLIRDGARLASLDAQARSSRSTVAEPKRTVGSANIGAEPVTGSPQFKTFTQEQKSLAAQMARDYGDGPVTQKLLEEYESKGFI